MDKKIDELAPSINVEDKERQAVAPTAITRIEAFRQVYNSPSKLYMFWSAFIIWTIALALTFDTSGLYLAFATSHFNQNPLLSTIGLLTSVMGAVIQPFWGKLADVSARPLSLAISLALYTLGYIVSSACKSVQALAAGQIISNVGSTGLVYLQTLIIADITSLQSRGLAYGVMSISYLPFAFVAPNIASGIGLEKWRWGYGMFCIIMPVCVAPILAVLFWADKRAIALMKANATPNSPRISRTRHFVTTVAQVDPFGLLLLGFAMSLLFSPPTLYTGAKGGWKNPSMIAMEVCGGVILLLFVIWEWKFAPHPLLPRRIFNRNFTLCFVTTIFYFLVGGLYTAYWSSWLWVVQNYSQRQWTYINESGGAALCVFSFVAGIVQRLTHRYWFMQIAGIAVSCVGCGINFYATYMGHTSTIAVVFAMILFQGGCAFALMAIQTVVQASVRHEDLAIAIALLIFVQSLVSGIGGAAAGSVWTKDLPVNLAKFAPSLNATDILDIVGDITVARVSEPRDAIIGAFEKTYRKTALLSLIFMFPMLITAFFCTEINLDTRQNAIDDGLDAEGKEENEEEKGVKGFLKRIF
ncbi:MFS general substrate transporter [Schizopora paradoxa]|uniref:MFS general substrate transporter n=1 Tax=Schizopora paradoxa TaxID=27342 RepID=A0A0H2RK77_9AGAM|nr:MFS general substrate transporter [Schizopora paradoxa]